MADSATYVNNIIRRIQDFQTIDAINFIPGIYGAGLTRLAGGTLEKLPFLTGVRAQLRDPVNLGTVLPASAITAEISALNARNAASDDQKTIEFLKDAAGSLVGIAGSTGTVVAIGVAGAVASTGGLVLVALLAGVVGYGLQKIALGVLDTWEEDHALSLAPQTDSHGSTLFTYSNGDTLLVQSDGSRTFNFDYNTSKLIVKPDGSRQLYTQNGSGGVPISCRQYDPSGNLIKTTYWNGTQAFDVMPVDQNGGYSISTTDASTGTNYQFQGSVSATDAGIKLSTTTLVDGKTAVQHDFSQNANSSLADVSNKYYVGDNKPAADETYTVDLSAKTLNTYSACAYRRASR